VFTATEGALTHLIEKYFTILLYYSTLGVMTNSWNDFQTFASGFEISNSVSRYYSILQNKQGLPLSLAKFRVIYLGPNETRATKTMPHVRSRLWILDIAYLRLRFQSCVSVCLSWFQASLSRSSF
jgi:hypothetical protein